MFHAVSDQAARAIDAAASWARRSLLPKWYFRRAVTGATTEPLSFAWASFQGLTRQVVVRTAPTASRSRKLSPPLDPSGLDPWTVETLELAAETRQLAVCRTCHGDKTAPCPVCGGSGEVSCRHCGGVGRTYSARTGGRQCRSCKGTGHGQCRCRDGLIRCPVCEGKGKSEEWLEVEEQPFTKIARTPGNPLSASFDRADTRPVIEPAVRWYGRSVNAAPDAVRPLLAELKSTIPLDPKRDRIDRVELEIYQSVTTTVAYELAGVAGTVQVQDWDGQVCDTGSSRAPLQHWRRRMAGTVTAAFAIGLLIAAWYSFRHPYFSSTVNSSLLWALAPALGLSFLLPASLLALPGRARRRGELLGSGGLVLVLLLLSGALALGGNPSVAHASLLADAGRLQDALLEAGACIATGRDPDRAAALHDRLQLRLVREAGDPASAWKDAQKKFFSPEARRAAERHALSLTLREARRELAAGRFVASEASLKRVPEHLRDHPQVRPLRLELAARPAKTCMVGLRINCAARALRSLLEEGFSESDLQPLREQADELALPLVEEKWKEIRSRAPIEDRLQVCREIGEPMQFIAVAGTGEDTLPVSRARVGEFCEDLEEQQTRLEERRREREERAREARQRAWAYAPLRCNDGMLSPSCTCGRSNYRGCCSHHGGVDGCSVPYP